MDTHEFPKRFRDKIVLDNETGCWNWRGTIQSTGYGVYHINICKKDRLEGRRQKMLLAHRLAYETLVGPIPAGLCIDHLCRNRACVNPAHMEVVTRGENVLRGYGPGATNARKTHCIRGHPFNAENTTYTTNGERRCRTCARMHARRDYWRNREARLCDNKTEAKRAYKREWARKRRAQIKAVSFQ